MKRQFVNPSIRNTTLAISVLALSAVVSAQAQVIDDFSGSLSAYNQTIVLAQSADPAFTFSDPSGSLQVAQTSYSGGAQQDVYLRDDFSLAVGQVLRIDTTVVTNTGTYSDFGLAISSTKTPTAAVWTSGTADARANLIDVYAKGQYGTVGYAGFGPSGSDLGHSSGVDVGGFPGLLGLYISRPSSTEFDVGYTTASGDTLLNAYMGADSSLGTAIGFYADLRANTTYGNLDNLGLSPIPEPTTLAFCGLGGFLGLVALIRRKHG